MIVTSSGPSLSSAPPSSSHCSAPWPTVSPRARPCKWATSRAASPTPRIFPRYVCLPVGSFSHIPPFLTSHCPSPFPPTVKIPTTGAADADPNIKKKTWKSTRTTAAFLPSSLLCKRLNIANPYPDGVDMESLAAAATGDLLSKKTMDKLMSERNDFGRGVSGGGGGTRGTATSASSAAGTRSAGNTDQGPSSLDPTHSVAERMIVQREKEAVPQRPAMDLFAAIFQGAQDDDSSSGSESSDEEPPEEPLQVKPVVRASAPPQQRVYGVTMPPPSAAVSAAAAVAGSTATAAVRHAVASPEPSRSHNIPAPSARQEEMEMMDIWVEKPAAVVYPVESMSVSSSKDRIGSSSASDHHHHHDKKKKKKHKHNHKHATSSSSSGKKEKRRKRKRSGDSDDGDDTDGSSASSSVSSRDRKRSHHRSSARSRSRSRDRIGSGSSRSIRHRDHDHRSDRRWHTERSRERSRERHSRHRSRSRSRSRTRATQGQDRTMSYEAIATTRTTTRTDNARHHHEEHPPRRQDTKQPHTSGDVSSSTQAARPSAADFF